MGIENAFTFRQSAKFLLGFCLTAILMPSAFAHGFKYGVYSKDKDFSAYNGAIMLQQEPDTASPVRPDTAMPSLRFPLRSNFDTPYPDGKQHSMDLKTPPSLRRNVNFEDGQYRINRSIGNENIGEPEYKSVSEYLEEDNQRFQREYFKERAQAQNFVTGNRLLGDLDIGPPVIDKILGGGIIDIKPQGSAELIFSGDFNRVENPAWSVRQQRTGQFKFDQKIQLNVLGTIGDRINLGVNYDTEANFDFDNEIRLKYEGKEDDIVQSIEAGNVNMPLPGSLITGSQSLFGLKTKLQFGKLMVTTVFSQQKSETKEITIEGGAQRENFEIRAAEYDANRHFFLAHYFREQYDRALSTLPILQTDVQINRVEVYVTNRKAATDNNRNILAFADLGEPERIADEGTSRRGGNFPDNDVNSLFGELRGNPQLRNNREVTRVMSESFSRLSQGNDFAKVENARQLQPTEYKVNNQLGYISLNQSLSADEVLAVAFEYTLNGQRYQVGEFALDQPNNPENPNVLYMKMLKSMTLRVDLPIWDLMMKNVYALGGFQIQKEEFRLQIFYDDDRAGTDLNYIPEENLQGVSGVPLIRLFQLDRLNSQQEPQPDGLFDFLENRTINTASGRIFFPVLEPFGTFLEGELSAASEQVRDYYVYQELYDSTQFQAEQEQEKNKFIIRGNFQAASGSEINLEAINIPEGSVRVTAGGAQLRENVDYTVDYTLGRVNIINNSILNSGQVIKVSLETQSMFNIQQKTLVGTRLDYTFNPDFQIGGTFMHLRERPLTRKVNIGDEPLQNSIWGIDGAYRTDSRFLTKLVDKIPLINTKAKSEISINGEFAQIIPGHPRILGDGGTSYIDDFEGTEIPIDLRMGQGWSMSSVPEGQGIPFAEAVGDLRAGHQRALITWYRIDNLFYRNNNFTPDHIRSDPDMQSNHYMREVHETEIFPNKQLPQGLPTTLQTFDVTYYPNERGPYNFNVEELNEDGTLDNPLEKFGGVMRAIDANDFEAANVEYMEFWLLDPFIPGQGNETGGGDMYINIGNVSEDILKDGLRSYENGLPTDGDEAFIEFSPWGKVSIATPVNYAFDNEPATRPLQDVGLDGLNDEEEREHFEEYLEQVEQKFGAGSEIYQQIADDPANDNYRFYRGSDLDAEELSVIERYKRYNMPQGNSPTPEQWPEDYTNSGKLQPDVEDINQDFTLNEIEEYFQYHIELRPNRMNVGDNFITDKVEASVQLKNGETEVVNWYQFKIPIRNYTSRVGQIRDFRSIRFFRMWFTNFEEQVTCRFGRLQLVRSDWRRFLHSLEEPGETLEQDDETETVFNMFAVNLEANGRRSPIPYVMPPGIQREIDFSTTEILEQNEQSLSVQVCELEDGDGRAAFKNTNFDVRRYKRLRMFVHAESVEGEVELREGDLWMFIRLGTDLRQNYYEYSLPLRPTPFNTSNPEEVWKEINEVNIEFEEFYRIKQLRELSGLGVNVPFQRMDSRNRGIIRIVGNPDLSMMRTIMLGVKNPSQAENTFEDDGRRVCGEVWFNELRVTDFDDNGGWAAVGRMVAQLADFGRIQLSANRTTIGFGGIEQKLQDRSMEDIRGYDLQTSFQLGKFFPQKANVKIPMFYSYSEQISRPEFNPLSQDIRLQTRLDLAETQAEEDSIRRATESYTSRKSLNFTNVQKGRGENAEGPPMPYDLENFMFTYAYTDVFSRNINTEYDILKTYRAMVSYNYNFPNKVIRPFRKLGNKKYLKILSDFNLSLLPQTFSFRTEVDRRYAEVLYRNIDNNLPTEGILIDPIYDKNFIMRRVYDFKYNITRSLRLTYSGSVDARVDEPFGPIDDHARDSIISNLANLGRTTDFNQRINVSYDLPINKIPILDWVTLRASYDANYNWTTAPPAAVRFGNTVQNSRVVRVNNQLNMIGLYNKITFFKTINQKRSNVERIKKKRLNELLKEWRQAKAAGEATEEDRPTEMDVKIDENSIELAEAISRVIMSVRNINVSYDRTEGIMLPGFLPQPGILGNSFAAGAPGMEFILGSQQDIRWEAARNGWLTRDPGLNNNYMVNEQENLQIQGLIEPINGLRINIDMNRRTNMTVTEIFKYDNHHSVLDFVSLAPVEAGTYSTSFFSLRTAFAGVNDAGVPNTFVDFENARFTIAQRLSPTNETDPDEEYAAGFGFPLGYGRGHPEVLSAAFIAAYTGQNPMNVSLSPFQRIPAPNWRLTYDGLGKLPFLENIVNRVNINHVYRSNLTVANYQTNLRHDPNEQPQSGQYVEPALNIGQITIMEQLAPLIGIQIDWVNNWTTNIEYKTDRNLNLNLMNQQINEMASQDFVVGVGYRTREFKLPFKVNGRKVVLENDLNFRMDLSMRNNRSVVRVLDGGGRENPTGGSRVFALRPNLDYVINQNFSVNLFFNRNVNTPAVSTSYPTAFTNFGFSLRYNLGA